MSLCNTAGGARELLLKVVKVAIATSLNDAVSDVDRGARLQGAHLVPPQPGDVEQLARVHLEGDARDAAELRKARVVRVLGVDPSEVRDARVEGTGVDAAGRKLCSQFPNATNFSLLP